MAIFKCLQSGNTVTFTLPHDIQSMEGHQGYERIDADEETLVPEIVLAPPAKQVGRPRKVTNV